MNVLTKSLAAFLLVLGTQACTTPGGAPPGTNTSGTDPTGTQGAPPPGGLMPASTSIPTDPGPAQVYRIGPSDLLKIEVFQVDELTTEGRVSEEGAIIMPLIGSVKVGRLTPREAEQLIANRLGERYLNNPQVSVFVSESAGNKVTVTGQVKSPGVFPLGGRMTLMQAIAEAGGLDEAAKKEETLVYRRQVHAHPKTYVVDLASIEQGRLADPVMLGDDLVVVPKSGLAALSKTMKDIIASWTLRALPVPY